MRITTFRFEYTSLFEIGRMEDKCNRIYVGTVYTYIGLNGYSLQLTLL